LPAKDRERLLADNGAELLKRKDIVCNMNILFWILLPNHTLRWLLSCAGLVQQDLIFELLSLEPPPMIQLEIAPSGNTGSKPDAAALEIDGGPRMVSVVDHLALFNTALMDRVLRTVKYVLDASAVAAGCDPLSERLAQRLVEILIYLVDK
ncbi:unnamed protein product, partial [Amoebophrya sp. A25]